MLCVKIMKKGFKLKLLTIFLIFSLSFIVFAQDTAPTNADISSGNLSDQDRQLLNYEHSGYLQRDMNEKFKEECEAQGKSDKACEDIKFGREATSGKKFLGLSPGMIGALSKAYTMIIGVSGLGSKIITNPDGEWNVSRFAKKDKADNSPTESSSQTENIEQKSATTDQSETEDLVEETAEKEKKEEKQEDYCRYIAMGTETIATFMQTKENELIQSIPVNDRTAQVDMLYQQKNAHLSRARSVNTQVIGWGASAACYTAVMLGPASPTSVTNWLKLGASTLLWRYYSWEKKTHKNAAKTVQAVIDKLGSKGECNPINDRGCYCAQPETQNDQRFCLPQLREGGVAGTYQVSCLTGNLKNDPTCACATTNTCLDKRIKTSLANIHVPKSLAGNISPFFEVTKGISRPGANEYDIDSGSNKLFANASKILRDNATKLGLPNKELSKKQIEEALALSQFLPNSAAKKFASAKSPKGTRKFSKKFKARPNSYTSTPGKISNQFQDPKIRLRGGQALSPKSPKRNGRYNSKRVSSGGSQKVLRFATKATKSAQIYKDKSLNIFDVVSNRYRRTAKKRLEVK